MKNNIYTPNDFFAEARNEAEVNNFKFVYFLCVSMI